MHVSTVKAFDLPRVRVISVVEFVFTFQSIRFAVAFVGKQFVFALFRFVERVVSSEIGSALTSEEENFSEIASLEVAFSPLFVSFGRDIRLCSRWGHLIPFCGCRGHVCEV